MCQVTSTSLLNLVVKFALRFQNVVSRDTITSHDVAMGGDITVARDLKSHAVRWRGISFFAKTSRKITVKPSKRSVQQGTPEWWKQVRRGSLRQYPLEPVLESLRHSRAAPCRSDSVDTDRAARCACCAPSSERRVAHFTVHVFHALCDIITPRDANRRHATWPHDVTSRCQVVKSHYTQVLRDVNIFHQLIMICTTKWHQRIRTWPF